MKSTNDVVSDDETIVSVQRTNREYDFSAGEAQDVRLEMDYLPIEVGFCYGCRRDAFLPIGADPLTRRCLGCILRRSKPGANGDTKRDRYRNRYRKCKHDSCANFVRVRKDTSGYCALHGQRKKHCAARGEVV